MVDSIIVKMFLQYDPRKNDRKNYADRLEDHILVYYLRRTFNGLIFHNNNQVC